LHFLMGRLSSEKGETTNHMFQLCLWKKLSRLQINLGKVFLNKDLLFIESRGFFCFLQIGLNVLSFGF
jgi:hypothetical protein